MAQEAEHFLGKEEATGSNPVSSSKKVGVSFEAPIFFMYDLGFEPLGLGVNKTIR